MSMFHELMMKKKGIPSRYQEVEYIESTGTQWIDTGIVRYIDHTYRYVGEVSFSDITNRQVMGVQGNAYFGVINGKYQIGNPGTDTVGINAVLNTFVPFDVTYDIPNQKIYYSIAEYLNLSRSQSMLNTPPLAHFHLFSLNDGVLPCSWKLKPIQIYDNGTLVRNYIPVYDTETQKYGMWESVQGKFCGNAGTGDFKGSIVGYTVVGSPTIVDGIVSGFSSANYLQIAQTFPSVSSISKVQEQVVFTTGTIGTQQMVMGGNNGAGTFGFELRTNGKLLYRVAYTDTNNATKYAESQTDTILTENTKYKAIGSFDIDNLVVNIKLFNENNVLLDDKNSIISSSVFSSLVNAGAFYIGRHWQRGVFTGSIDLNETDIKINNKLWFNGQQA